MGKRGDMEAMVARLKQTPMTAALLASFVLIFVLQLLSGVDVFNPDLAVLLRWGANMWPLTIINGEGWRLVSSAFLHIGLNHLLFNMLAMFILGSVAERLLGRWRLLALFLLAAVGGALLSAFMAWRWHEMVVSAGASGGIMGLAAALLVLAACKIALRGSPLNMRGLLVLLVVNLLYGFLVSGVDNAVHIGGALTGALIALLFVMARRHHCMWFDWLMMALLALGFAVLWVKWHDWFCLTAECMIWH